MQKTSSFFFEERRRILYLCEYPTGPQVTGASDYTEYKPDQDEESCRETILYGISRRCLVTPTRPVPTEVHWPGCRFRPCSSQRRNSTSNSLTTSRKEETGKVAVGMSRMTVGSRGSLGPDYGTEKNEKRGGRTRRRIKDERMDRRLGKNERNTVTRVHT